MTDAATAPTSPARSAFPVEALRAEFPALALARAGRPVVYLDGPGGTQVPQRVIDAVSDYFVRSNANHEGAFETSERSDAIAAEAHAAVADLLGAGSADEIHFGPNMTTLTFHVSRSIAALLEPGDEILVTTLDHEANRGPWQAVAVDRGLVVRSVDVRSADVTLDLDAFEAALGPRTRLVAIGYASNAVGSINPVKALVARAHAAGALTYIDAVHYAPHGSIDVADLGTDFLACSVYKWFGPHQGVLYVRPETMDRLPRYKLRPAHDPIETGTQAFELQAGTLAAVEYLRAVGRSADGSTTGDRRPELLAAMRAIAAYEREIGWRMLDGLLRIPGVRVWGITEADRLAERTPTFAITIDGLAPRAAATELGRAGIFTWDGDFYATGLIERLGLANAGGVLRLGLVHYNTAAEVDRTLGELERLAVRSARGA
jgi:cysteine desulfurase family protein (TIGR01976 family)